MEKNVSKNERITTVILDGTECAVTFFKGFNVFEVRNNSSGEVLMSLESGKHSGEDGTVTIASGEIVNYIHMRYIKTCYLTGTGEVTVAAKDVPERSFSGKAKGGDNGVISGILNIDGGFAETIIGKITTEDPEE